MVVYALSLRDALPILTLTTGTLQVGVATNGLGTGSLNLNGGTLQSSLTASLGNNFTVGGSAAIGGSNNLDRTSTRLNTSHPTMTYTVSGTTTNTGNLS